MTLLTQQLAAISNPPVLPSKKRQRPEDGLPQPPDIPNRVVIDVNASAPQFGLHANPPVSFVYLFIYVMAIVC